MANDNQVNIVGNLTDDPELRYTPNGAAVCKFRVAVNRRYKDESGQWKDGETSYFSVNAWRTLAEKAGGQQRDEDRSGGAARGSSSSHARGAGGGAVEGRGPAARI